MTFAAEYLQCQHATWLEKGLSIDPQFTLITQEWVYFGELTDGLRGDEALAEVHRLTGAVPRLNARINAPPDADDDVPRQA